MLPPLVQHRVADKLEPWCKFQSIVPHHRPELFRGNVLAILNLIGIESMIDVGFDEQYVVN